jgi:3-methyladenine DNA glycosylase/8-oxoguanine DNA glycosylase
VATNSARPGHFRSNVRRQYGLADLPTAAELRALAEPWRPYRSFGTWYHWRSGSVEPRIGGADEVIRQ